MKTNDFLFDGPERGPTLAFAHGAGAPMDSPWMNDVAFGLAGLGLHVVRFEFPYMRRRRDDGKLRRPDQRKVLLATWKGVIKSLQGPLVIGGTSLGGRMASMVAEETGVAGWVCMSYPFHPPGRPEHPRVEHLREIRTPGLIVQGTRDPFGAPDEIAGYELAPQIRMEWLDDGDHALRPRVKSGRTKAGNLALAIARIAEFVHRVAADTDA